MQLRPATLADCADLAILDDMAGFGLPAALLQKQIGVEGNAMEALRRFYRGQSHNAPWRDVKIAHVNGDIAGMIYAYVMPSGQIKQNTDPVMVPINKLRADVEGQAYIDALAVYPQYRGKGLARQMLKSFLSGNRGHPVSLIAANDNANALALYESEGFKTLAQEKSVPFNEQTQTEFWLLMQCSNGGVAA